MTQPANVTVIPEGPEGEADDTVITTLLPEVVYVPSRPPPDTVIVLPLRMKPIGKESVNVSWGNKGYKGVGGGVGSWAEVVHTTFTAAAPVGGCSLSQVALPWSITVRKLLQLESLYNAKEALTPHDNACKKICKPSMVGPAVQLFHVVTSGFGAPEKLEERTVHDVSSYVVMVTDTSGAGGGGVGSWAEVVHTTFRAAAPGGGFSLSQVALPWTITVRKLWQLESLYNAKEALTPHDNAFKKICVPSMVGPAVQLFHVVTSGFGAPEKLEERTVHDVSSYAVMVTDTPGAGGMLVLLGAGGMLVLLGAGRMLV
jgi:hypothetical protein